MAVEVEWPFVYLESFSEFAGWQQFVVYQDPPYPDPCFITTTTLTLIPPAIPPLDPKEAVQRNERAVIEQGTPPTTSSSLSPYPNSHNPNPTL